MSFKLIVDSCCDLTPAQLREECFVKVPLTIRVGNHTIVDDDTFDQGELLWRMKESETAPQSACPSPMQYLEALDCGADDVPVGRPAVKHLQVLPEGGPASLGSGRPLLHPPHKLPTAKVVVVNSLGAPPPYTPTSLNQPSHRSSRQP